MQRARDRRRAEREHVDLEPQLAQQLLLRDAEPLLLVDDDEAELLRDHVAREHAMRPDEHVHLAGREVGEHLLHLRGLAEARDHVDAHREVAVALAKRVPVLLRQHGGRYEHQRLLPAHGDGERGPDGDFGLPEADVTAHEPVHRPRRFEVFLHGFDRGALILGLAVRELALEALDPLVVDVIGDSGLRLPLRVELNELAGHLAQVGARPRLQVVPRLAAELREGRRLRVGADVAADLADLLVRDVDAVVAAVGEQQVVARDTGDLSRLEAEELRDAVVLVHDVVAGAQVGEALQCTPRRGRGARRALAEDLRVGQQRDTEVTPDEAATRRSDGEGQSLRRLTDLEHGRLDPAQELLLPESLAAVREGNDHVELLAKQAAELVLGLGEAARRDRRPLRVEGERLPLRHRRQLGRAVELDAGERLLGPERAHLVGLPDEIRAAVERRARDRRGSRPARPPPLPPARARGRRARCGARRPDRSSRWSSWRSARCVNGENARICSISSPKSSMRSGSRPVVGKTSTSPPRTANWPRSSTRSTRS